MDTLERGGGFSGCRRGCSVAQATGPGGYVDRCIGHGLMPTHWRSALVTPVPKRKRDLSLLKSWRPVSVTPLLCRLCETVVHYRVQHVIEQGGHRRGKSQFGFRRGVGTSLPLSGLSMFIRDGLGARQSRVFPEWDARDPEKRDSIRHGEQATAKNVDRQHSTLLVSIDGSDAYCRALPHKAIRKLLDMGLANEARWVAALLTDRSLIVKSGRCRSAPHPLMRGVPQGSVLAPMLWSLVIDDLIAECERICDKPVPGCVVVPIIFADDVNFAIRGFNPQSCIAQANVLMQAVRAWSLENGVPMAKLQASWIVGGNSANWARDWTAEQGEVIFDDNLRCTPKTEPIKLLGVTFDSAFCFDNHVDSLVEQCERYLRLLTAMKSTLKGERLAILYRGMILSRMLFAVDAWYPFLARCHRDRLEQIHERGCRIITGTSKTSHGVSACYEAGFRSFEETARDEIVKLADRMRRMPGGDPDPGSVDRVYGTEWVARLFRDGRMPTAGLRPVTRANGLLRVREPDVYPFDDFDRALSKPDSLEEDALRDIGFKLHHGDPRAARRDPRALHKSLRPLPRVHPWAPHELAVFDTHISFVASAPDGLVKQRVFDACGQETGPTEEQALLLAAANAKRIQELVDKHGSDAVFIFTDGSRVEEHGKVKEACAGAFIVCIGPDPTAPGAVRAREHVPVGPIACVYTAELAAISAGLRHVTNHAPTLFRGRARKDIVVVTDSKSSLDAMRGSWLRRIGHKEQDVCRQLFDLATRLDAHISLAFVFSHADEVSGNHEADQLADAARDTIGRRWTDDVWNVDSTRRILLNRHKSADAAAARSHDGGPSFRFRAMPEEMCQRPSERLPRAMSRADEMLLYRARIGMLASAGGSAHTLPQDCPFCGEEGAMCRDGGSVEHLAECLPRHTEPPVHLDFEEFWTDPVASAAKLRVARDVAKAIDPVRGAIAARADRGRRAGGK